MSHLEELVQTFCPDGVEYRKLGGICQIATGKLNVNKQSEDGLYPFFTCAKEVYRIDTYAFDTEALLISGNGNVGYIHYYKGKFNAYQRTYVLHNLTQNIFFIKHVLEAGLKKRIEEGLRLGSVPYIKLETLSDFYIPIPPLPVQEEIVRILDTFSGVVAELEQKLNAEQAARVRQYEHYRNELLSFDSKSKIVNEYKLVKIKDIARRNHGTNITANRMKVLHKDNGPVRVFAGGSTFADIDYSDIPKKDIIRDTSIIIKSRGYIGFEYYEKPFSHKNEFWSYTFSKECNTKYIYYFLLTKTDYFQQKARASSVKLPQLSVSDTDNFLVPLPSLEIQEKIVSILDRFTTLVNDLKSGLPAEIALRRKQYEYYRDKLLTFQPLE